MPMWDDLIDEAARRLTTGEPAAGFTARVLARVDDRPRARWSRAWLAVPAAVAAIVAWMIVMPRERTTEQPQSPVSAQIEVPPTQRGIPVAEPPPRHVEKEATTPRRTEPAIVAVGQVPEFAPDIALEAISIASVDLSPMDVEALPGAPPIAVDEIGIEPLEISNSGQ